MAERVIIAGFGGQGVLLMGQLLAKAGMLDGKHTVWLPSYGPEMRGGTANCSVIVSKDEIFSPIVTGATSAIVMNRPSLDKFEKSVIPGGKLFINSSIIDIPATRRDIEAYYVPCNEIANELGFSTVSNMVMLGAYLEKCPCVEVESALKALLEKLGEKKAHLLSMNREAFARGAAAV